jgi:acetyl-CoA carboxylase biotin carboxyl carrier protein
METKEIQKLIDYISKSDLDEVKIETDELKLHIKRNTNIVHSAVQQIASPVVSAPIALPLASVPAEVQATAEPVLRNAGLVEVKSPMIGTFYRSAGPGKPNFKEIGDDIAEGEVFCIIEAMKLFNEIEAEVSGKIVKILIDDATPVEFDQPLFLVDPS